MQTETVLIKFGSIMGILVLVIRRLRLSSFADVAWQGFQKGISESMVCTPPAKMLNKDTYMELVAQSTLSTHLASKKVGKSRIHPFCLARCLYATLAR